MPLAILLLLLVSPNAAVPPGFDELFRTGLIALQRGDLPVAESNLREASRLQAGNGRVWVALSQTYWKLQNPSKAEELAVKAAQLAPDDSGVLQGLVIYYSESGQTPKAAEAQARYASLNPGNRGAAERAAVLYFEAAQPLLQSGQFAGAISLLRVSTSKVGRHAQTELALGVAYYGLRRFDESAEAFLSAIALEPTAKQPYVFLGKMLDQIPGRLPEVTKHFIEFEQANPADYEGYLLHAKGLDAQSIEPETARKLLEKAIAINGGDASAHFELGALLDRMHLFAEAATEFERSSKLAPSDPAAHYRLSRLYDRLKKPAEAEAERERHRALVVAQNALR